MGLPEIGKTIAKAHRYGEARPRILPLTIARGASLSQRANYRRLKKLPASF
jgi:hypothetical protein